MSPPTLACDGLSSSPSTHTAATKGDLQHRPPALHPGILPEGRRQPSQLQTMGTAKMAEERLGRAQLPSLGSRLQEGRFGAEQSSPPVPVHAQALGE